MPRLQAVRSAQVCLGLAAACRQELRPRCCVHLLQRFLPVELFLPAKGLSPESSGGAPRLELARCLRLRTAARFASWSAHPFREVQRSATRYANLFSRQGAPADEASSSPPPLTGVSIPAALFLLACGSR